MQISYADAPGPTVTLEEGKSFPFLHHLQVRNANGNTIYPVWQLWGGFQPPSTNNSPKCLEMMLQEGGQEPRLTGPHLDQGGPLDQGGLGRYCSHDHTEGEGQRLANHIDPPP